MVVAVADPAADVVVVGLAVDIAAVGLAADIVGHTPEVLRTLVEVRAERQYLILTLLLLLSIGLLLIPLSVLRVLTVLRHDC